uniref:Zinc finger CCCH-type with G patch domain-containing protein n=1 Tax=Ciona savignyi TaxID=51511 RepID=H2YVP6_CIOSA
MDDMRANLETHRNQLSQIEAAISAGQSDPELLILRDDITSLISLTEESLLDYEKSQLMALLSNTDDQEQSSSSTATATPSSGQIDKELACFYAETGIAENTETKITDDNTIPEIPEKNDEKNQNLTLKSSPLNDEFLTTIEHCDDVSGVKCRAPYTTEWSGAHHHNAMIMSVVTDDNELEENTPDDVTADDIIVKVLFLNPTMHAMMPCPYFLEDKCSYTVETCKYSHGHYVSLYSLHAFHEPDFTDFDRGSSCLAKLPDGLWSAASLDSTHEDLKYTVKFQHRNLSLTLGAESILPTHHDDSDSDSSTDDDDVVVLVGDVTAKGIDTTKFGAWEEHTRGIGSKIMLKLGYKLGEGLGTGGVGIVEPVQVEVLPVGKSLDHCMKIKEKRRAALEKRTVSNSAPKQKKGMFNFLNKALGDKKRQKIPVKFRLQDAVKIKDLNNRSVSKKMNQEIVKNDSKIKQIHQRIRKLKESVTRNKERNPRVAKQLQVKLNEALNELKSLKTENTAIEQQKKRAATHRKMTEF